MAQVFFFISKIFKNWTRMFSGIVRKDVGKSQGSSVIESCNVSLAATSCPSLKAAKHIFEHSGSAGVISYSRGEDSSAYTAAGGVL